MNIDLNLSFNDMKVGLARFLARFHVLLYTILVIGGLAAVMFFVYQVMLQATDIRPIDTQSSSAFDQNTIDKLQSLNEKSGGGKPLELPSNQRINPFVD